MTTRSFWILTLLIALMPFAAAQAQDGERSLLCHRAVAHTPIPDVTYQPGTGVNGKAVTPANVPSATPPVIYLPTTLEIPLTVDLAQWLGLSVPTGTQMETVIGLIEVAKNGDVTYNGENISARIDARCNPGAGAMAGTAADIKTQ